MGSIRPAQKQENCFSISGIKKTVAGNKRYWTIQQPTAADWKSYW